MTTTVEEELDAHQATVEAPVGFTPGPWGWYAEDNSEIILCGDGGADPLTKHVVSIRPCKSCQPKNAKSPWEWGQCITPKEADAKLIAMAPTLLAERNRLREALEEIARMTGSYLSMRDVEEVAREALGAKTR